MALTNEELDVFFDDAADGTVVDVSFNGAPTVKALRDTYDEQVIEGQMGHASVGRVIGLVCKASVTSSVLSGATAQIGSSQYKVIETLLIQDGEMRHFRLQEI